MPKITAWLAGAALIAAVPARDVSTSGEVATTSTVSLTEASCSLKSTLWAPPSCTSTFSCFCSLNPLIDTPTV